MKAILKRNGNRGAGLTEYIIVVGLIGIGTLGGVMLYGDNIRGLFSASGNAMAGDEDTTPATKTADVLLTKNMKNFANNAGFGSSQANTVSEAGKHAARTAALNKAIEEGNPHPANQMPKTGQFKAEDMVYTSGSQGGLRKWLGSLFSSDNKETDINSNHDPFAFHPPAKEQFDSRELTVRDMDDAFGALTDHFPELSGLFIYAPWTLGRGRERVLTATDRKGQTWTINVVSRGPDSVTDTEINDFFSTKEGREASWAYKEDSPVNHDSSNSSEE